MKRTLSVFYLISISFLGFGSLPEGTKDREVIIASFEGKQVKVIIHSDYINNRLTIKSGHSDSICIDDYLGNDSFEKIEVFDRKFILFPFVMRGGTGETPSIVLILCVVNGRLHTAFTASSESWAIGGKNDEDGTYNMKVIGIPTDSIHEYKLIVRHYEKITSVHHSKKNYEALDTLRFNFDKENKVFYNQRITLNGSYMIDSLTSHRNKNFKSETYPAIEIKRHHYLCEKQTFIDISILFINGKWYNSSNYHKNHLSPFIF